MFRLYYCIEGEHDLRLVVLASLICVATASAVVTLLRQAHDARGRSRCLWLAATGATSGFGIWATHFIAMIGYDPGVVIGYAAIPTALSLLIAIAAATGGFAASLRTRRGGVRWLPGVIVGGGIAGMHYLGTHAVEIAAEFRWAPTFVLVSIAFAIGPIIPALSLTLDRRGRGSAIVSASLFVAAVLLLHFTGMAAITLIPDTLNPPGTLTLSPIMMGVTVAVAAGIVLSTSITTSFISRRARAAIDASEREFKVLVQGISDCAIYMLTAEGLVASWNAGAQRLKGYTRHEAIGRELATFYSPQDRLDGLPTRNIETARHQGKFNAEGWRYRKDGSRFWAHVTIEAVYDELGAFHGFAKITRDMTRLKEDQERLESVTANLDTALSNMHQGLCLFGPDERLILANDRVRQKFGITDEQYPPGTPFEDLVRVALAHRNGRNASTGELAEAMSNHRELIARPEGGTMVITYIDGSTLSIAHRPMPGGGWVTTFDDITERRRVEQRIEHMALHDSLTGLANRVRFNDSLDEALARAEREGTRVAVVGIDLDRFKEVNDMHGHAVGDALLRKIAGRMAEVLEAGEFLARIGGDEFAAFKTIDTTDDLAKFVDRLDAIVSTPTETDGIVANPRASFGVAVYPTDGTTREQLVNNADLAMYRAKDTVGRHVCYYEQGMDEAARARRVLANDLSEAIDRGELSLAYQVQKSVRTEEVVGHEALLRWHHPRDGWISPAEFIPIAEECGEILRIGEWALRTACRDAADWPRPWRVAVNLSPVQLMHPEIVQIVIGALADSGLPAARLELEITETALVDDKVRALHVLRQIKALGVSIAIDDFGTGYSSLDTLNSFPIDKVKIDKSFLMDSQTSTQARAIIRAVLALGRSLGVPVLAEGLESDEQLRLLRSEGCDEAQGYLWGRPIPAPLAPESEPEPGLLKHAS